MKTRGRPFSKGNPGRPKGARHKATHAIEALLEGDAHEIGRKCIEMAKDGDATALRLAMERICPVRRARIRFNLPPVEGMGDLPRALSAVLEAIADGSLAAERDPRFAAAEDIVKRYRQAKGYPAVTTEHIAECMARLREAAALCRRAAGRMAAVWVRLARTMEPNRRRILPLHFPI